MVEPNNRLRSPLCHASWNSLTLNNKSINSVADRATVVPRRDCFSSTSSTSHASNVPFLDNSNVNGVVIPSSDSYSTVTRRRLEEISSTSVTVISPSGNSNNFIASTADLSRNARRRNSGVVASRRAPMSPASNAPVNRVTERVSTRCEQPVLAETTQLAANTRPTARHAMFRRLIPAVLDVSKYRPWYLTHDRRANNTHRSNARNRC